MKFVYNLTSEQDWILIESLFSGPELLAEFIFT